MKHMTRAELCEIIATREDSSIHIDCIDFSNEDLSNLYINYMRFTNCIFTNTNLENAKITYTDLVACNFIKTNFKNASINNVSVADSDFKDSNIFESNAVEEHIFNLNIAKNIPMACPESGSFIGYKIVTKHQWMPVDSMHYDDLCILKLEIPKDAKRSSSLSKKCRCSKAKVLNAYYYSRYLETHDLRKSIINSNIWNEFYSLNYRNFKYFTGEMAFVDDFDDDRWNECSSGIHFFMTKGDVMKYIEWYLRK